MKTNRQEIEYLICTILKYNFFIRIKGETHKNLNRAMNAVNLFDGEWFFGVQELESNPRLEAVFFIDDSKSGWDSIDWDGSIGVHLVHIAKNISETIEAASHADPQMLVALKMLLRYIASGQEYPDAIWKVTSATSGVSSEALGAAYDEYCAKK